MVDRHFRHSPQTSAANGTKPSGRQGVVQGMCEQLNELKEQRNETSGKAINHVIVPHSWPLVLLVQG